MKIVPINNFNKISFSGKHDMPEFEDINDKKVGYRFLNHTTCFFRYPKIDEFVISKIKKECKENPVKIISAGCSYGEEVFTYSMLLDDFAQEVQIDGIDISKSALEEAKKAKCEAIQSEAKLLFEKPEEELSDFEKTCRKVFNKHYIHTNPKKHLYIFEKKQGHFQNCTFKNGDIRKLTKIYPPNSADVILCRYVLYHLDDIKYENVEETRKIVKQFYDVLKPNGLLVLAESEEYDGLEDVLYEFGFELADDNYPNVYKKVSSDF